MTSILLAPGEIALSITLGYVGRDFFVPGILSKPTPWQFYWIKCATLNGALLGLLVGAVCALFHWASFGLAWLITLNAFTYTVAAFILIAWLLHLFVVARLGREAYAELRELQRMQSENRSEQ